MRETNAFDVLRQAMRIEKEGIRFYTRAANAAKGKAVSDLFRRLARDELLHLEKLELVHDNLAEHNEWLVERDLMDSSPRKSGMDGLFDGDPSDLADMDELGAVEAAVKAEKDSITFYARAMEACDGSDGRGCSVFKWLLAFEHGHLAELNELRRSLAGSD